MKRQLQKYMSNKFESHVDHGRQLYFVALVSFYLFHTIFWKTTVLILVLYLYDVSPDNFGLINFTSDINFC